MRPIGYDGNNPTSVAEWLESLELGDYTKSFLINGYTSMELVKKIWEIELINVSAVLPASCFLFPQSSIRHRKWHHGVIMVDRGDVRVQIPLTDAGCLGILMFSLLLVDGILNCISPADGYVGMDSAHFAKQFPWQHLHFFC